jgi:hypothetical protein
MQSKNTKHWTMIFDLSCDKYKSASVVLMRCYEIIFRLKNIFPGLILCLFCHIRVILSVFSNLLRPFVALKWKFSFCFVIVFYCCLSLLINWLFHIRISWYFASVLIYIFIYSATNVSCSLNLKIFRACTTSVWCMWNEETCCELKHAWLVLTDLPQMKSTS